MKGPRHGFSIAAWAAKQTLREGALKDPATVTCQSCGWQGKRTRHLRKSCNRCRGDRLTIRYATTPKDTPNDQ